MRKIGIYTLNGNYNYGNRLQNYALKKIVENLGFDVETIWFISRKDKIIMNIKNLAFRILNKKRKINFMNFSNKYLNIKYYYSKKIANKYDKFVVGSDQVWNYNFPDFDNSYFLTFSPYEKNISYAASFGINDIAKEKEESFRDGLNNIKCLSVREENGKSIVEKITGRTDCKVCLDPTMLLTKDEWEIVSKKPSINLPTKYILTYFLGELSDNRKEQIQKIAQDNSCEIINILDQNNPFYNCGPSEFLYLEKNAFLICTDSFHSCVFAIIFEKPFLVFDRVDNDEKMNSRLDTLLQTFDLSSQKIENYDNSNKFKYDTKKVINILEKEKLQSIKFLRNALDMDIK